MIFNPSQENSYVKISSNHPSITSLVFLPKTLYFVSSYQAKPYHHGELAFLHTLFQLIKETQRKKSDKIISFRRQ